MHMVAASLGCQKAIVGTWWATTCLAAWEDLETLLSPRKGLISDKEGCLALELIQAPSFTGKCIMIMSGSLWQ